MIQKFPVFITDAFIVLKGGDAGTNACRFWVILTIKPNFL